MLSFASHKITSDQELLAKAFKYTREKKRLSLDRAAELSGINLKYLAAIENGVFSKLPEGVYGKKYIKSYADFLGVDCSKFFEKDSLSPARNKGEERLFAEKSEKQMRLVILPKLMKNALIFCAVLVCFLYLQNRYSNAVTPPALAVTNPPESFVTADRNVIVSGLTEQETEVMINGKLILSDAGGKFREEINLRSGMNTITVTAKRKYGQENTVVKQVLVK